MTILNLCFSGGGSKGIAYIGSIKCLEDFNVINKINKFSGASIGAFFALACNLGYSSKEMMSVLSSVNLRKLRYVSLGQIMNKFGYDTGKRLEKFIKCFIRTKNPDSDKITFKELHDKTGKHLIIVVTDLAKRIPMYIDFISHPNLEVSKAVKISMTLPFVFTYETLKDRVVVDGGLTDNFPINVFAGQPKNSVLGLYLLAKTDTDNNVNIRSIDSYVMNNLYCVIDQIEKYEIIDAKTKFLVSEIDTEGESSINFDITDNIKKKLITNGYDSVNQILKNLYIFEEENSSSEQSSVINVIENGSSIIID